MTTFLPTKAARASARVISRERLFGWAFACAILRATIARTMRNGLGGFMSFSLGVASRVLRAGQYLSKLLNNTSKRGIAHHPGHQIRTTHLSLYPIFRNESGHRDGRFRFIKVRP